MKFELTNETKEFAGRILHRIKALKDFSCVSKGSLGGWVEKEDNLSQEGNCWVYGNARVSDDAWVYDNAQVCGNDLVYGDARVSGDASVSGDSVVKTGKITKESDVFNLIGGEFDLTVTKDLIKMGCKEMSYEDAMDFNWDEYMDQELQKHYKAIITHIRAIQEISK